MTEEQAKEVIKKILDCEFTKRQNEEILNGLLDELEDISLNN